MISVVIPVYNAAPYLKGCIQSILGLGIEKEIIIVDDGSTDGGVESLNVSGNEYAGVRIIRQENQGVSAARNAGLKLAKGEWVWFVDADDSVSISMDGNANCSATDPLAVSPDSNFCILGFVWDENGAANRYGANVDEIPYNLWRCWFRRDLIEQNGLSFTMGRKYAEDQEFILKYLIAIGKRKAMAMPEVVYYYTMRPGSAMTRAGMKQKQVCDIAGVILTMWGSAIRKMYLPAWIWGQTRRLLKTMCVTIRR